MAYHPERLEIPVSDVILCDRSNERSGVEQIVSISPEGAARAVANMSYDSVAEFIKHLSANIDSDGERDSSRGRKKLANGLYYVSMHLDEARDSLKGVWKICKPYMKKAEVK